MPSSQLCVKLASGGDPTYAFNIRFTGEEVHGTSRNTRPIVVVQQMEEVLFGSRDCVTLKLLLPGTCLTCLLPGGSFRHFLWQVCKELQSSVLSLLLPCPSAAANRNKVTGGGRG